MNPAPLKHRRRVCLPGGRVVTRAQEAADALQALQVAEAHGVVPCGFADAEENFAVGCDVVVVSEDGDVGEGVGFVADEADVFEDVSG